MLVQPLPAYLDLELRAAGGFRRQSHASWREEGRLGSCGHDGAAALTHLVLVEQAAR